MGTHPSGPSRLRDSSRTLRDHLGLELPFLFKVLSVGKALSIQAHPNKALAAVLHAEMPQIYKDPNHKPEMAVALTEFEALCGFRPVAQTLQFVESVPELRALVPQEKPEEEEKAEMRRVFSAVMKADAQLVKENVEILVERVKGMREPWMDGEVDLGELVLRLAEQYPGDVGVFAPFFLNVFHLQPGEALFLGPDVPHAYLSGDCVEAMACSDNVVRAGLTPKFRDVETLCGMLTYECGRPLTMMGVNLDDVAKEYVPPVSEFKLLGIQLESSRGEYLMSAVPGASIAIVLEGAGSAEFAQEKKIQLKRGDVLLVEAGMEVKLCASSETALVLFRCSEN